MKRYLFIAIMACISVICQATPPRLASEAIFNRKDIRQNGNILVITKTEDNFFRSVTASNNKELFKAIKDAVAKDRKRASNTAEGYTNGKSYIILNIPNNNQLINVGFWDTGGDGFHFFIQANAEAFR